MEALTIKTFKTSKISAAEVRENRFKFENKNGPVYSLAISCSGDNETFFRKLDSVIANQSCKNLRITQLLLKNSN